MASFDLRTLSYLEVSQANLSAYSCIDNMLLQSFLQKVWNYCLR